LKQSRNRCGSKLCELNLVLKITCKAIYLHKCAIEILCTLFLFCYVAGVDNVGVGIGVRISDGIGVRVEVGIRVIFGNGVGVGICVDVVVFIDGISVVKGMEFCLIGLD